MTLEQDSEEWLEETVASHGHHNADCRKPLLAPSEVLLQLLGYSKKVLVLLAAFSIVFVEM
jgi:hypothetical protein